MAGNIEGGRKAARANIAREPGFYSRIGSMGGRNGKSGGFASKKPGKDGLTGPERAALAGKLGGLKSRRKKKPQDTTETL